MKIKLCINGFIKVSTDRLSTEKFSTQLPLGLSLKDEATFDNFYAGKNLEIITALKKTIEGKAERSIFLYGSRGQGCTHLLHACCHYANQHQLSSVYLPLGNLLQMQRGHYAQISHEILSGMEAITIICLDDLHVIAGKPEWEEALFHLFNRVFDMGGRIVMTASDSPKAIHLALRDLESRLSWGIVYKLHSLTDEEKLRSLIMRAKRRGIDLSEEVGKYLLTHCPRHMGTLFAALDALDKASLAAQRRLTIPFVKDVLEI
ncbi:MAG: DnaA regulatory inactivator Hda [Gammaproteobacteria bacterium]|nr:DnaA regulatory inactivator Hda [Gammaproteobacteria bacterium]